MTIPTTQADEALAREISAAVKKGDWSDWDLAKAAQLIAAHVAAQAPVNTALPASMRTAEVAAGMDWLHNRTESAGRSIYDDAKEEHALLGYIKQLEAAHSLDVKFPGLNYHTAQLVRRFAAALGAKLLKAQEKYGRSTDWMETNWQTECQAKLLEHVAKGDPLDVAAYAAFLWHHSWRSTLTQPVNTDQAERAKEGAENV